jgi:hypothetical protein
LIAQGGGVVVHINKMSKQSIPLPQEFHDSVFAYEQKVEIIK